MSTTSERILLTEQAITQWHAIAQLLRERGETWPDTDVMRWGVGLQVAFAEMRGICTGLDIIGGPRLDQIVDLHDQRHRGQASC